MKDVNVYYTTKRPGYVVQEFKPENLVVYDEEYLKKYDNYDQFFDEMMNVERWGLLRRYINPLSLLDVGYGRGTFLKIGKRYMSELYGYDITNADAPEDIILIEDNFQDYSFDVVTFFDSLEHVPVRDIVPYLKQFNTKCFYISVPWYHSTCPQAEWFKNWKHRRENEHLHFFDSFGLINIMNELGYNVVHISNCEDGYRSSEDNKPNILTVIAIKK